MSKRDRRKVNIWDEDISSSTLSPEAVAAHGYGDLGTLTHASGKVTALPISIFDIRPDLMQPRRAMPSEVRAVWDGEPASLNSVLNHWWELAQREADIAIDLSAILDQRETDGENVAERGFGPIEASLRIVTELAASIGRDGLTNPITVIRSGDLYVIETGERRWLAYHLLNTFLQDEKWSKIPARVMDQSSVWRQASENTARQDLNAVGKARQFAVLMMDMYSRPENGSVQFKPYDACTSDREYYAQVVQYDRVPYGKREELLNAMGAKTPATLTRCRKLLSVPDEVWTLADDFSLPEDRLLTLADLPEEKAILVALQMVQNVSTRNVLDIPNEKAASPALSRSENETGLFSPDVKRNFSRLFALGVKAGQGDSHASEKLLSQIEQHRKWLDELERLARKQM